MQPRDNPMYERVMLSDDDPPYRRLMWALLNPDALKAAYETAHIRADRLRKQLRELEIDIGQAQALVNEMGLPSWPTLRQPVRPPTLHEAMRSVLEAKGNGWMRTGQIAREVARRCLYRRRDGLPATTKDVSARASRYEKLFERQGVMIRLRQDPDPSPSS